MSLSVLKVCLPKTKGYNYQQDAVAWVKSNNKDSKPVFYDESRMRYYANVNFISPPPDNWLNTLSLLKNGQINQYQYLLINFSRSQADRKLYIEKELPEYSNVMNFYDAKAKKHTAVFVKK